MLCLICNKPFREGMLIIPVFAWHESRSRDAGIAESAGYIHLAHVEAAA